MKKPGMESYQNRISETVWPHGFKNPFENNFARSQKRTYVCFTSLNYSEVKQNAKVDLCI
jgi:hypothetical protein